MTTDRHACGLSSFLPMSCRGRAEAFARRLQSRLQSLGRQPSGEPNVSEESWLTTSQHFPTNHQPVARGSSSSDSDVYFDFDVYFGSPGSPLEEATEDIHVNRPVRGCATSSSATASAASPGSDDSNYFDPEGFDFGKNPDPCGLAQYNSHDGDLGTYYDCRSASTDTLEDVCKGSESSGLDEPLGTTCTPAHASLLATSCTPAQEPVDATCTPAHASLLATSCTPAHEPVDATCTPAHASLLATSCTPAHEPLGTTCIPAHASLLATCCTPAHDDLMDTTYTPAHETPKTMSPDVTDNASPGHGCVRVRKPRVDYTKCNGVKHGHSTETHEAQVGHLTETHEVKTEAPKPEVEPPTETHEAKTEASKPEVEPPTETHEAKTEASKPEVEPPTETHEAKTETHEAKTETHEARTETHEAKAEACTPDEDTHTTKTHESEVVHFTETRELGTKTNEVEVKPSTTTMNGLNAETPVAEGDKLVCTSVAGENVYCSTLSVSMHELLIECPSLKVTTAPDQLPKEVVPPAASGKLDVDDIDYDERPQRVRRCSSLKTGKTPPGTPGRKKIVRFADVLGLDLADVRTFLDEVPKVPTSAYEDLQDADLTSSLSALVASMPKPDKTLVPMFVQPGGCADFFDRVREQQVCLENAVVSDVMLSTISGTVRVRNLDFNKSVHIRYSADGWKTFSDLQASYVQNSCDGFSDTFRFVLYAHTLTVGQRLEFAVRFQCHGCQYWDSNRGGNYVFQCLPPAGQLNFRSHLMSTCPDEQWASFY